MSNPINKAGINMNDECRQGPTERNNCQPDYESQPSRRREGVIKPKTPSNGYKSYFEKLKDPRWQKRRLQIMERDKFACLECRSQNETLHVHHRLYRKGLDPWDYEDGDLMTLCETCHSDITSARRSLDEIIGALDLDEIITLNGFIRHTRGALEGNWASWVDKLYQLPFCGPKSSDLLNAEHRAMMLVIAGVYDGLLQPKSPRQTDA